MRSIQYIADYQEVIRAVFLCVLAALALRSDVKSYKIPNKLNLTFLILGLLLNLTLDNLKPALIGMVLPMVLFPLFVLRMMGAGDIKLFCAIGAIVGFPHIISIVAYSILFNGVIAVFLMLTRQGFNGFARLWQYFKYVLISGKLMEYQSFNKDNKNLFRYAYGIVLGCIYYVITGLILGGSYALL